jgi:hypothetical protein
VTRSCAPLDHWNKPWVIYHDLLNPPTKFRLISTWRAQMKMTSVICGALARPLGRAHLWARSHARSALISTAASTR